MLEFNYEIVLDLVVENIIIELVLKEIKNLIIVYENYNIVCFNFWLLEFDINYKIIIGVNIKDKFG